jgi:dihydroflavonol-4-reductase
MKIFVTGGDGFLGSNLVRELLERRHDVCVLVEPDREVQTLDGLDVKTVKGNLLDFGSLKAAARDAESIIHVAACTSIWPPRNELVKRINIEGTRNIINLTGELSVKRLVHVGTANTFGYGTKENPGQEDTEYMGLQYGLDYMDSKWKAHQLVMDSVKKGVPALVVNPTFMFGPYDSVPNTGMMIISVYLQKMPGYAPGGRNYISVNDVVKGISNALDKGKTGESYILGNENLSYKEAFEKIASVLGVPPPKRSIPGWMLLSYGKMVSILSGITGRKPEISYPMAKIACDGHYYSSEKAVRELDLPQTPIEEGIGEAFNWLKSNGCVE